MTWSESEMPPAYVDSIPRIDRMTLDAARSHVYFN